MDRLDLPEATTALLTQYGFPAEAFTRLMSDLCAGRFPSERNRELRPIEPPLPSDLTPWAEPGSSTERQWNAAGTAALRRGEVAVCILNGGMATRFGGRVKGVVEVFGGRSFLELRLRDIASAPGPVPVFLMSSFATAAATAEHLGEHGWFGLREHIHPLVQRVSVRLTPEGEIFRDASGMPSLYAPGHGDVFEVLAGSEAFGDFVAGGGKIVMIGNVDNLGATISPKVIGAHLTTGRAVTVEVAPRHAGDAGGAPVRVGGRLEIVEGFRFPAGFDTSRLSVFNTNTLIVGAAAIKPDYPLTWFRADKTVDGRPAVQFERLMGEVTSFVESAYLEVPREGSESRFIPVKTPQDLSTVLPLVRSRLGI